MCNNSSGYEFQIKLLPPMYGIEMCVALIGNIFALWLLVTRERQNWHTGVVFSCNLVICDILYVLTLPLLIIYYDNEKKWNFGNAACKIERFLFNCNLYGSIFFIMCISVNRYLAIVFPFFTRSYVLPKHAKIASVLTWFIVIIISLPVLKFAGTEVIQTNTLCTSSHDETLIKPHFKYTLFLMVVGCMIPLLVTFASYLGVIWTVLKNKNITTLEKRKVALMVALVCILYATSFVPYHFLQTYNNYLKSIKSKNCWRALYRSVSSHQHQSRENASSRGSRQAAKMPSIEFDDSKPSWADQVEEEGDEGSLPSPKETVKGNIKTVTEYKIDEDGQKVKIVRTFKIETRKASKAVARRKNWKKFGNSEYDQPGPNVATTTVSDDVFMTFISSKEDLNAQDQDEDPMNKLKGQKIVSCRICKGDHWTTRCPYKDTLGPMQKELAEQLGLSTGEKEKAAEPEPAQPVQSKTGKYVPPSLRDGGTRRGESMQPNRRADDNATIRVTNLSEDTRETDLQELFRPFGSISRIYLAKDKNTGQSKGFAFISFHRREDAARAIAGVSGFGYDHLILNVEWAKPSNN
ncbi:hypothetical protein QQF64_025256 [Cirrhinus molitorella]|uniref:Eukaryotic translation initiation factor 3 subunit G n=1 Tax=Cirrhinus molitorella TaxID=172907 RepID=A0ABR3NNN4_9TELE